MSTRPDPLSYACSLCTPLLLHHHRPPPSPLGMMTTNHHRHLDDAKVVSSASESGVEESTDGGDSRSSAAPRLPPASSSSSPSSVLEAPDDPPSPSRWWRSCRSRSSPRDALRLLRRRTAEHRRNLTASELSGSLGDLGTFIPLTVALARDRKISLAPALFWAGASNVVTGCLWDVPMCVQPMKSIAAVALADDDAGGGASARDR